MTSQELSLIAEQMHDEARDAITKSKIHNESGDWVEAFKAAGMAEGLTRSTEILLAHINRLRREEAAASVTAKP